MHQALARACDDVGLPRQTLLAWSGEILLEFLAVNIAAIPGDMLRKVNPEIAARLIVDAYSMKETVERLCTSVLVVNEDFAKL